MRIMKQVLFMVFCFCFSSFIYGQVSVDGVVLNSESNKPIVSAHVTIEHNNKTLGTTTDQNGNFTFNINPEALVGQLIEVTAIGYHDLFIIFDNQKNLTLRLTPKVYEIQEVQINPKSYIKILSVSPDTSGFVNDSTEITFIIAYNIIDFKKRKYETQVAYKMTNGNKYRMASKVPKIRLKTSSDTIQVTFPVQFINRSLVTSYPYNFKFFIKKKREPQAVAWTEEEYEFK